MPAITIDSLPSLVYEQLMQAATLHQRNLTQEIVTRLEQSFSPPTAGARLPRHPDAIITEALTSLPRFAW